MNKFHLFTTLMMIAIFTACTTQVEMELPEPGTTDVTTENDNDGQVTLRSTDQECIDYYDTYIAGGVYTGPEFAEYVECRLNQGFDETEVMNTCDSIDQTEYTACIDWDSFINNYWAYIDRSRKRVADSTDSCPTPCEIPYTHYECQTPIFTVEFLNDDNCPNSPDEWEFRISAVVYCCD